MLKFSRVAIFALALTATYAAPSRKQQGNCLSAENAQTVATKYGELISAYSNAAADALLTPDFIDYSSGVNALINTCPQGEAAEALPLLDPTFTSRAKFEIGQDQQPLINFDQTNLWFSCDSVTIRWKSTNTARGANVKPIIGLIVMETVKAPAGGDLPFLIKTVYSEFDSGSWLQNLAAVGFCGPTNSVVGAPAPVPAQSSAAPAAAQTSSAPAGSCSSMAVTVPTNGITVLAASTASHSRA